VTEKEVLIIRQPGRKDRYLFHSAEVSMKDVFRNVFLRVI